MDWSFVSLLLHRCFGNYLIKVNFICVTFQSTCCKQCIEGRSYFVIGVAQMQIGESWILCCWWLWDHRYILVLEFFLVSEILFQFENGQINCSCLILFCVIYLGMCMDMTICKPFISVGQYILLFWRPHDHIVALFIPWFFLNFLNLSNVPTHGIV
jgi:hypothetical protein